MTWNSGSGSICPADPLKDARGRCAKIAQQAPEVRAGHGQSRTCACRRQAAGGAVFRASDRVAGQIDSLPEGILRLRSWRIVMVSCPIDAVHHRSARRGRRDSRSRIAGLCRQPCDTAPCLPSAPAAHQGFRACARTTDRRGAADGRGSRLVFGRRRSLLLWGPVDREGSVVAARVLINGAAIATAMLNEHARDTTPPATGFVDHVEGIARDRWDVGHRDGERGRSGGVRRDPGACLAGAGPCDLRGCQA